MKAFEKVLEQVETDPEIRAVIVGDARWHGPGPDGLRVLRARILYFQNSIDYAVGKVDLMFHPIRRLLHGVDHIHIKFRLRR